MCEIPHKNVVFNRVYSVQPQLKIQTMDKDGLDLVIGQTKNIDTRNAIFIGKLIEVGQGKKNVWLDNTRAHSIYLMGKRRSGKSYSLGIIAEGLLSEDWIKMGSLNNAVLIFDTLNIFPSMRYKVTSTNDLKEIKKWEINPVELDNITYYYPAGTKKDYYDSEFFKEFSICISQLSIADWCSMFKCDPISDPMGQLISDLISNLKKKKQENYSINEILIELEDKKYQTFKSETLEAIKRRFNSLNLNPVFAKEGIKISDFFTEGKVGIILLRELEDDFRSAVVGLLVRKIFRQRGTYNEFEREKELCTQKYKETKNSKFKEKLDRLNTIEVEKVPQGWILIDEAHNYLPAIGSPPSKKPLIKFVKEGRNYGLSIVCATQSPSSLDQSIRRNADILIIHSLSYNDDIQAAKKMLNTLEFESISSSKGKLNNIENVIRDLDLGEALISDSEANRIFAIKFRPRTTVHGGRRALKSLIIDTHEAIAKIYPLKVYIRDCIKENIVFSNDKAAEFLVAKIASFTRVEHEFKSLNINARAANYIIRFLQELDLLTSKNLMTPKGTAFQYLTKSSDNFLFFDEREKFLFLKYLLERNFAYVYAILKYIKENDPFKLDSNFMKSEEPIKLISEAVNIALILAENIEERISVKKVKDFLQTKKNYDSEKNEFYYGYSYKTRVHKILPIFSLLGEVGLITKYRENHKNIESILVDEFIENIPSTEIFMQMVKNKNLEQSLARIYYVELEEIEDDEIWDYILIYYEKIKDKRTGTCYLDTLVDIVVNSFITNQKKHANISFQRILKLLIQKNRTEKNVQILPDRWGNPRYFFIKN